MNKAMNIQEFWDEFLTWEIGEESDRTLVKIADFLRDKRGVEFNDYLVQSTEDDNVEFLSNLFDMDCKPEVLMTRDETEDGSELLVTRINTLDVYLWRDMAGHYFYPKQLANVVNR